MKRTSKLECTSCEKGEMIYERPIILNNNNPWGNDPAKLMNASKLAIHRCNRCGAVATLKPLEVSSR